MKFCTKCNIEYQLEDFYKHKWAKDGRKSWCKKCHGEERVKRYWAKTREAENKRKSQWRKENPLKCREQVYKRRAQIYQSRIEPVSYQKILERDGHWCYLCCSDIDPDIKYPDRDSMSYDHVIPLSKGGSHTYDNIRIAHLGCNWDKNAK